MSDTLHRELIDFSSRKLQQLTSRIETCLGKLTDDQIWARGSENENAIGNLVLHLSGNVRQWIVSGVGEHPGSRDRDAEFAARSGASVLELAATLRATVTEAVGVLEEVTADRLEQRVVIQNYEVSVLEAICHVVEHFSGHTGQIIFATKMLTGEDLGFYRHQRAAAVQDDKTP